MDVTPRFRLALLLSWTSLVVLTAGCASAEPSVPGSGGEPSTAAGSGGDASIAGSGGDAAVWVLGPDQDLRESSTKFIALVSRLGCNNGVTGQVLEPEIRIDDSEVVVTFSVAPKQLDQATCPSNDQIPYEVDLSEPLRDRALVDGRCLPGEEAATTSFCVPDATRFRP